SRPYRSLAQGECHVIRVKVTPRGAGALVLTVVALLLPQVGRGDPPTAPFEAEKKAIDAEEKAIRQRETYFAGRKMDQDKESARLKAVHAELVKEKERIAAFRQEYQARKKRYEKTRFPNEMQKQAELAALKAMAKKGKAMVAAFNARNATYAA